MRFASLLSGGFTTMAEINSPEIKLANRTSVQWYIHKIGYTYLIHRMKTSKFHLFVLEHLVHAYSNFDVLFQRQ